MAENVSARTYITVAIRLPAGERRRFESAQTPAGTDCNLTCLSRLATNRTVQAWSSAMTAQSTNRVLVLGRPPAVLQDVTQQLVARGVSARSSIDAEHAADQFDARDFDLISFGSGVVGPLNERLRQEFTRQSPQVQFLDVFAPVAVKQIISALAGPDKPLQYVADFHVAEDGSDYVMKATILQPCEVRIEVHQTLEAPLPRVKVVEQSAAAPGPFERRIDAHYRIHGHMLVMTLNDDECCWHRMQARHQSWQ
jgi:hypothetical protein